MEKAVVLFFISCLAVFGVVKLIEFVQSFFALHHSERIFMVTKPHDNPNIELFVRAFASAKNPVLIIEDNLSKENKLICRKTAEKLKNISICSSNEIMDIIK